ncbi:major facilitator superfamily transporter [Thalassoglobus neptunius]|uniref:Major facilitator superfamily transporter n=1 Tax=Thalassoglobus neptunius TaxID=1938619 RepID=A0A5C5X5S7_9PLAN|nr:MFS transporter [Thalassoglobus neptunius]TWT58376.1 major facilitator superfamily transporter [Thalassoglobus neptunius]
MTDPHAQTPEHGDHSAQRIYTRRFWIAFAANVMMVTANTMTFRFAEFVKFLGGTEETTGFIVSVGLLGSLFFRAFLGQALDTFGIRRIWLICATINMTGGLLMMTSSAIGLQLYLARIIFVVGLSGMFASSVSYIQSLAPVDRRTEIIGTFGASGFVGMILGAQLGDLVFLKFPNNSELYYVLFGLVFLFGFLHTALAFWLTSKDVHRRPEVSPPIHKLLVRYWPSSVLIVTVMMGIGFAVTMTFLTRYSTELGLSGIRTFFTAYAITAFTLRIIARQWSQSVGRHRLIAMGLLSHSLGHFLMTFVTQDFHFIMPAMCLGFGHALLFPCVVSMGAGAFPEQYRGTGTSVTLAAIDLGTILTAPFLGWIIDHYGFHSMFFVVSGTLGVVGVSYGLLTSKLVDADVLMHRKRMEREAKLRHSHSVSPADSRPSLGSVIQNDPKTSEACLRQ